MTIPMFRQKIILIYSIMPYGVNKFVKRVGRQAKKRFVRKGMKTNLRNLNYSQIAKDVKMLKGLVNAEKQNADFTIAAPVRFALSDGAGGTGAQIFSIHPTIAQGISEDHRKGDTYKVCSMLLQMRITYDQTLQDLNWKMYIVRKPDQVFTPSLTTELPNFLEPNPFTGVIDYNSLRNYQQFKDYVVLKQMSGKLRACDNSSLNSQVSKQIKVPLKLNFHTRYNKGTTNILANELFCILVADDKAINAVSSPEFECHNRIWYYDN